MTLYFNGAVDSDWNTLGNWWEDFGCTVAASALPASSDDVILFASIYSNSGSEPTIVNFDLQASYSTLGIPITITGLAAFSGQGAFLSSTINGNCTFSGNTSYNNGTITGNAEFIFPSFLDGTGTVSGTTTLTNYVLYFKNVGDNQAFNDSSNWFFDAAATIPAAVAPWLSDDATKFCDLHQGTESEAEQSQIYIYSDIGNGFTISGTCTVTQLANYAFIFGGTFTGDYFTNYNYINAGKFQGSNFSNQGYIRGGLFIDIDRENLSGNVEGGDFAPSTATILFFKSNVSDYWHDISNWFSDYEATIPAPIANPPWITDDETKDYWLCRSLPSHVNTQQVFITSSSGSINIGSGFEINGTCTIGFTSNGSSYGYLYNQSNIYSGTFSGISIYNDSSGYIYNGTFTGDSFDNSSYGGIYNGTFTGYYFNNNGNINGGIFTGDYFNNSSGTIYYGTFTGEYFTSNSGTIYYGIFSGDYCSIGFTTIYNGLFSAQNINMPSTTILNGMFDGAYCYTDYYIYGGIFSYNNFSYNNSYVYSGFWLQSGKLDVFYFLSETMRMTGKATNPVYQFNTITVEGQDVLGTGLL